MAMRPFARGATLLTLEGEWRTRPTQHSVQVGWDQHIAVDETLGFEEMADHYPWRFLNHSCDGNVRIRGREVVAVRAIRTREEITFNYNATEFDMSAPFACRCGSPKCLGMIRGFKHLTREEQERLRPLLSGYLLAVLDGVADPAAPVAAP